MQYRKWKTLDQVDRYYGNKYKNNLVKYQLYYCKSVPTNIRLPDRYYGNNNFINSLFKCQFLLQLISSN